MSGMTSSRVAVFLAVGALACGGASTGDVVGAPGDGSSGSSGSSGTLPIGDCDPQKDTECDKTSTCEVATRKCVARKPCSDDVQCADRFICELAAGDGYCRRSCGSESDFCQEGSFCQRSGSSAATCALATTCDPKKGDDDCYGFMCDPSGKCGAPRRCATTAECGVFACLDGNCKVSCLSGADCAPKSTCDTGTFVCK